MSSFPSRASSIALVAVVAFLAACGGSSSTGNDTPAQRPAGQPASIAVTPALATVTAGQTLQFAATGTWSGGATWDLTDEVTWTSSQAAVATVSNQAATTGLVTAASSLAFGATTTTIGASLSSGGTTVAGSTLLSACLATLPEAVQSWCGGVSVTPAQSVAPGATITITVGQASDTLCRGNLGVYVGVPGEFVSAPGAAVSGQGLTYPSLAEGAPAATHVATYRLSANAADWANSAKCPTGQWAPNGNSIFMTSGPWVTGGTSLYTLAVPFTVSR